MATILKKDSEKKALRESGRRLAMALDAVERAIRPGISAKELDRVAFETIRDGGDEPAFLNYQPAGASEPFPASLCVSINDELVHGIPREERVLESGDLVSIDLGVIHDGLVTDSARTIPVGEPSRESRELLEVTERALEAGIAAIRPGAKVGDIGFAVESSVEKQYAIVRELGGHSVGRSVHESPFIPNFGKKGTGAKIEEGMVLALEPIITTGSRSIRAGEGGFTLRTADGSHGAHFEHTILVTHDGAEIVTIT